MSYREKTSFEEDLEAGRLEPDEFAYCASCDKPFPIDELYGTPPLDAYCRGCWDPKWALKHCLKCGFAPMQMVSFSIVYPYLPCKGIVEKMREGYKCPECHHCQSEINQRWEF